MSVPVAFMYAWHVRRQLRNWKTTLVFYWGSLIGILVGVVFVCGTVMMTVHHLS